MLYPIVWPIATCLDIVLHHDEHSDGKVANLMSSVNEWHALICSIQELESKATRDEHEDMVQELVAGVLHLSEQKIEDHMMAHESVVWLDGKQKVADMWEEILDKGHSRYPVYVGNPHNVVGLLLTKDLVGWNVPDMINRDVEICDFV
eukprot:UN27166